MRPFDSQFDRKPRLLLAGGLLLCAALAVLPPSAAKSLQDWSHGLLAPGISVTRGSSDWLGRRRDFLLALATRAEELTELQRRVERLEIEKQSCRLEMTAMQLRRPDSADSENVVTATVPLVQSRLIEARVLGQQARLYLDRQDLLDCGTTAGAASDAWVLTGDCELLDQGTNRELTADSYVGQASSLSGKRNRQAGSLSHGTVWGKLTRVGPRTSSAQRVNAVGYRDLVQLATIRRGEVSFGPRGVWEGTGERLCKVKLVAATEPVSVGDLVLTAAGQGLLPQPLLYGEVTRVERQPGATHWEIWVLPAANDAWPDRVAVIVGNTRR